MPSSTGVLACTDVRQKLQRLVWPLVALTVYYTALRILPAWSASDVSREEVNGCLPPATTDLVAPVAADIPLLERCAAADPHDAEVMRALGRAYEDQRQWAPAEGWYARALALNPDDADVHTRLGRLLLLRRDADGAATQAAAALRTQPGGPAALALARDAAAEHDLRDAERGRRP
jgi:cytochrome c-type biogenesis protein CcmH/NrfG